MITAQPPLEFIPPSFNPWLTRGIKTLLPLWLKYKTNIFSIEAENVEILAELYKEFQAGKVRFLMAFRHPSTDDPLCMGYLIWRLLPQIAKKKGIVLKQPIHSYFIYDRGIPLWAGETVGWLYSNLGGTPIMRGKTDLMGLKTARNLFANGEFPIAAAPEGATNGHNEIISPLEPGISQLCFWCAEDLRKAGRTEQVLIVPIGIQYHYVTPPWESLEKLLTQLEKDSGLNTEENTEINSLESEQLYQRLYRIGEHFLTLMEEFYAKFYHQTQKVSITTAEDPNQLLANRLHNLLDIALKVAEAHFGLEAKGNYIDRCRRLEQAGWDYIYRSDLKDIQNLSPFEKGLADLVAEEASLRMWHMRLVESFVAVTGYYVKEKPKAERFAEMILLLWDMVCRVKGGNPFFRPKFGKMAVTMKVAQPISISDRQADYQANRKGAVASLTQDLQTALQGMIINN